MKENRMNDGGRLKRSALRGGTEKLLRANGSRKIQTALVAFLAVMALVLPSGCTSVPVQANSAPLQYNPNTGSPAVGSEWPWVFHL